MIGGGEWGMGEDEEGAKGEEEDGGGRSCTRHPVVFLPPFPPSETSCGRLVGQKTQARPRDPGAFALTLVSGPSQVCIGNGAV